MTVTEAFACGSRKVIVSESQGSCHGWTPYVIIHDIGCVDEGCIAVDEGINVDEGSFVDEGMFVDEGTFIDEVTVDEICASHIDPVFERVVRGTPASAAPEGQPPDIGVAYAFVS